MKTENLFVPYELALLLKEAGFDLKCLAGYSKDSKLVFVSTIINYYINEYIPAPMYQQVTEWFRDKHKLHLDINHFVGNQEDEIFWDYSISKIGTDVDDKGYWKPLIDFDSNRDYNSYYEALNKAIEESLKLI